MRAQLDAPTDTAALAAFRVVIGLLVSISAVRFLAYGWVHEYFVQPKFFFSFYGFAWVPRPGSAGVHALFVALVVLGLTFAAGVAYRISAVLLLLCFAWVQLLDATNYLNHYYLVTLLLLLAACLPLGRVYSFDVWRHPERAVASFPAWMTYLLRFQVACVYVFAGKAKFGGDWLLHAQPLSIWLRSRMETPLIGGLFDQPWVAYAFSWFGFVFDSTIVLFLLARRTRPFAYVVVVVFHAMTSALFPIGMFPVIMTLSALVFFSPSWPRRLFCRTVPTVFMPTVPPVRQPWLALACLYCSLQLLVPLRTHLYGGNVLWHEQGMRFAWKVMVREKNGVVSYRAQDRNTGRKWVISPITYLDARQMREFSTQPDLILQLAHHIAREEQSKGRDVALFADTRVSLNGRTGTALIDPAVDLTTVNDGYGGAGWILSAPR